MERENLEQVRENIDRIDNEIIKLIAERGTYVVQAGIGLLENKRNKGIAPKIVVMVAKNMRKGLIF